MRLRTQLVFGPMTSDAASTRSSHPWINIWLAISLVAVLGITAARPYPERFEYGEELGDLLFDFGLAYAAAWIFHRLVVVGPQRRRDAQLHAVLVPKLQRLVDVGRRLQSTLEEASGRQDVTFPAAEQEVRSMCSQIPTAAPTGIVMVRRGELKEEPMAWAEYIDHVGRQSSAAHDEITALYPIIDPELLGILERERSAKIHKNLALFHSERIGLETLEWCAEEFAEYVIICGEIEAYASRKR